MRQVRSIFSAEWSGRESDHSSQAHKLRNFSQQTADASKLTSKSSLIVSIVVAHSSTADRS